MKLRSSVKVFGFGHVLITSALAGFRRTPLFQQGEQEEKEILVPPA